MIDESRLEELVKAIRAHYKPLRIILFGSQARGDSHEASDLNLCLVLPEAGEWLERQEEFHRAVDLPDIEIAVHIFTAEELARMRGEGDPFVLQVLEEGRVLHEQQ